MESAYNDAGRQEDTIDREVRKLIEEVEAGERLRRAVIDMLVMMGNDAALEDDV